MYIRMTCLYLLLFAALSFAAEPAKLEPCNLEKLEEQAQCGTLEVFENRAAKAGRKISLRVAVLKAKTDKPAPDPLFILQGGPGQSAIKLAEFYATSFAPARAQRDIVLVDQRGTGGSNRLKCELYEPSQGLQGIVGDLLPVENIRKCRSQLEKIADLTQYTTAIAMDDLDEVRAWLGYDKINLYGTSYGSVAALIYMQRHPEHLRSAVMKAVVAPDQRVMVTSAADSQKALDATLAACAADATCSKAYPNIASDFAAMMKQLEKGPVAAKIKDPVSGNPVDLQLSKGSVAVTMRGMLHSPGSANQLVPMIHAAAAGDFGPLAQTSVMIRQRYPEEISFGMFLSVICAEEVPFFHADEIAKVTAGSFTGSYWADQLVQACKEWPRGKAPDKIRNPISKAPVLLISGGLDPVTPPRLGDATAKYLPNSRHLVVPNAGHPFAGLAGCADVLIAEFLDRGTAEGLDFSCAAKVPRPAFK